MDSANVATIECVADKALSTAISSSLIVSVDVESVEATELLSLIDISTDCSMTATCFPVITEMMVSMAPSPKVSIKYFIKWKIPKYSELEVSSGDAPTGHTSMAIMIITINLVGLNSEDLEESVAKDTKPKMPKMMFQTRVVKI